MSAQRLVFVYGTLKAGFGNAHANGGERVPGEFLTVEPYPLYVVGPYRIPWLVDAAGEGYRVAGELYRAGAAALARMDALEGIGRPGGYLRGTVRVRPRDGSADVAQVVAVVYFGPPGALGRQEVHEGPIPAFTPAHDAAYRAVGRSR